MLGKYELTKRVSRRNFLFWKRGFWSRKGSFRQNDKRHTV